MEQNTSGGYNNPVNKIPIDWKRVVTASGIAGFVMIAAIYGTYRYWQLWIKKVSLEQNVTKLEIETLLLEKSLEMNRRDLAETHQALQAEQNKNAAFESQINQISGTVTTLKKLSTTDHQLLEKYSKIYFLNENYVPVGLSALDSRYLVDKERPELILPGVRPYLEGLLADAHRDGISLHIVSAYRSFYEQASLKLGYKTTYGTGTANQFSADQGYSEHQLGTTVDFGTPEAKNTFLQFASSTAYQWLNKNAYKFGFALSYPPNNIYYQFEPWHWRFVSVALATSLHDKGEYFYNLSQREINNYLVSFFD